MKTVEIYTKPTCPYCTAAKGLLTQKGVTFSEFDIAAQPELRSQMVKRSEGGATVPQIFIDGIHVGGCDDLFALEKTGNLDSFLDL